MHHSEIVSIHHSEIRGDRQRPDAAIRRKPPGDDRRPGDFHISDHSAVAEQVSKASIGPGGNESAKREGEIVRLDLLMLRDVAGLVNCRADLPILGGRSPVIGRDANDLRQIEIGTLGGSNEVHRYDLLSTMTGLARRVLSPFR